MLDLHNDLCGLYVETNSGMTTRLWNYVSTFSNLSGEKLHQIYAKLRQEQQGSGVGPSYINGSSLVPPEPIHKGIDTKKFEAWKRRRRAAAEGNSSYSQVQAALQRPMSNGTRLPPDPNSMGILGAAPTDHRHFGTERPHRMRQTGFPPRQGLP